MNMNYRFICSLLLLAISTLAIGQINEYTEVDAVVRNKYIKGNDAFSIAEEVTYEYESDEEKVRAIFVWIADNIEYSYETFEEQKENRADRRIKARDEEGRQAEITALKDADLAKALKNRAGVEADYAYMFVKMCEAVGIEAGEVTGYLRRSERTIGQMPKRPDHIWNWAMVNGRKQFFDTFLAAGTFDKKTKVFTKDFDDNYFMTKPRVLILSHYPEDSTIQSLDPPLSQMEYASQPFRLRQYSSSKIVEFYPKVGLIPRGTTEVEFKFKFEDGEIPHRILTYERKKLLEQDFKQGENGFWVLTYKVPAENPSQIKFVVKDSKLYEHEALIYTFTVE
jgi:hypothetical protein